MSHNSAQESGGLRIVEISHGLGLGGAEVALLNRLTVAPDNAHTWVVNTKPSLDQMTEEIEQVCERVITTRPGLTSLPSDLKKALRTLGPDVVVSHSPTTTVVLLILRMLGLHRVPVVVQAHSQSARWPFRVVLPILNRFASLHLAVSRAVATSVQCRGARRVVITYVGAKVTLSDDQTPPSAGGVFLSLGRITALKRHDLLLRAVEDVATEMRAAGWKLRIVGDGQESGQVARLIQGSGLDDIVTLEASRRPIDAVLAASDVLVVSSDYEGLPLVVFEALQAGMLIVSRDVGGISEVVDEQRGHLLVTPDSEHRGLATALMSVMDHSPDWKSGRPARRDEAQRWNVSQCSARHYAILTELIA
jgi:glycosyltransferase involved in cell wall biosynthesis